MSEETIIRVFEINEQCNDDWIRWGNRKKQKEELALHDKLAKEHADGEKRAKRRNKRRRR